MEGFASFYAAYPRKRGSASARKEWNKLAPDGRLRVTIMVALEVHKRTEEWRRDGGQFIPYPASWLKGRRWEDDLTPPSLPRLGPKSTGAVAKMEHEQAAAVAPAVGKQRVSELVRSLVDRRLERPKVR